MCEHIDYKSVLNAIQKEIEDNNISLTGPSLSEDNIFSVLDIVNKEVPYCKILLHLIKNNWESFEEMVLKSCCEGEKLRRIEAEYPCEAPCDYYKKEGRIDLLIETEGHVVIIEAKVYAIDQENQLFRYENELIKKFDQTHHIFYLTLDGHEPSDNSLKCEYLKNGVCLKGPKECECDKAKYTTISFSVDISNWLESIVSEYDTNSIAKQFLEVIDMCKNNYEAELKLLRDNINIPKTIIALNEAIPILWEEICQSFFDALAKELMEEKYGFEKNEEPVNPCVRETWPYALKRKNKPLWFCYETNFFLRTGYGEEWIYINKNVFEEDVSLDYFGTRKASEAFNVKSYSSSSQKLLEWFYKKDVEKKKIIEKIVKTAVAFHEKQFYKA